MSEQPIEVVVFGDPHLSGETIWQHKTALKIIEWVESLTWITKSTDVIILGDLMDKYAGSPQTTELVTRFIRAFSRRAKHVHILVGNHDISKKDELLEDKTQYVAYRYLEVLVDNLTMYEYPETFSVGSLQCVAIPYYDAPVFSLVELNDFSKGYPLCKYGIDVKREYDLVIAHHFLRKGADKSRIPIEVSVDVEAQFEKVPRKVLSGHIHTTHSNPEQYTGSLYPLKIDEVSMRYYWTYSNGSWQRKALDVFCELLTVSYGEPLPAPRFPDSLPVYTVTQCPSEFAARCLYPNAIIRKTVSAWEGIRKHADFSNDSSISAGVAELVSKETVLDLFEEAVLTEDSEWAKLDVSIDTLKEALSIIRDAVKEPNYAEAK